MSHFAWKDGNLLLRLKVSPRASKNAIIGLLDDQLKVYITAPPIDGKANAHLLRWVAKLCNVPKSSVQIISGESSRNKTIEITCPKVVPAEFQLGSANTQ